MRRFRKARDSYRRPGSDHGKTLRWVEAIPGGIPESPLEQRVHEVLAAIPLCPWDRLVAEISRYLRGSESPRVLALLDEGFWGGWVWRALAREELRRLEGVHLAIRAQPSPMAGLGPAVPGRPAGAEGKA